MADAAPLRRRVACRVERLATVWALAGGLLLLALVAVNTWSVVADAGFGRPFPGTFELTEMGVAVAVFAFLPYCQLTGANVTVDLFTQRLAPRGIAALGAIAAATALGFTALLGWRMALGMADQKAVHLTTTILQVPVWTAFVPILASLALLAATAAITLAEAVRAARQGLSR